MQKLASFFPERNHCYQAYHKSLTDWLLGEAGQDLTYQVDIEDGHRCIAECLLEEYRSPKSLDPDLVLEWAPHYLDATDAWEDWAFLSNFGRECYRDHVKGAWICWERALALHAVEIAPELNNDLQRLLVYGEDAFRGSGYHRLLDPESLLRLRIQLRDDVMLPGHRISRFDWARLADLLAEQGRFSEARIAANKAQEICQNWSVDGDEVDRGMERLIDSLPS